MNINGLSGVYQGHNIPVAGSVVFGRNPQTCTVVFPDEQKGISRMHCRIDQTSATSFTIMDLGSSYGTFLNGQRLQANVPMCLKDGDTFWLGDNSNMFSVSSMGQVAQVVPMPMTQSFYPAMGVESATKQDTPTKKKGKGKLIALILIMTIIILFLLVVVVREQSKTPAEKIRDGFRDGINQMLDN